MESRIIKNMRIGLNEGKIMKKKILSLIMLFVFSFPFTAFGNENLEPVSEEQSFSNVPSGAYFTNPENLLSGYANIQNTLPTLYLINSGNRVPEIKGYVDFNTWLYCVEVNNKNNKILLMEDGMYVFTDKENDPILARISLVPEMVK